MAFYIGFNAYAIIVHTQASQLLPQLLMQQDILNICMKEFGSEKIFFLQNDSCENLDNFSLIWLLYMH